MQPKIVVITGPTASGKTALGVALAQRLGGEVVSAWTSARPSQRRKRCRACRTI